jgi:ankyrin repeat protein
VRGGFDRRDLGPLKEALAKKIPIAGVPHNDPMLIEAAHSVYKDAVALLLQHGAKPDAVPDGSTRPALHEVLLMADSDKAKVEALEIVKLLLKAGANPNGLSPKDQPISLALRKSEEISLVLVAAGAKLDARDLSQLIESEGKERVLKEVIARGLSPNSKNSQGATLLTVTLGDKRLYGKARILLEGKADPNLKDDAGTPPLHVAAVDESAVRMLLRFKADVRGVDKEKKTALHAAVKNDCLGCVKALLEAGADPNAVDGSGLRPLDYANKGSEMFELLKKRTVFKKTKADTVLKLPSKPEVEKLAKVFRGEGGELVTIVAVKSREPALFLIKFEGFAGSEWNERVVLHYLEANGDSQDYKTRGDDFSEWVSMTLRSGNWNGLKDIDVYPKGMSGSVRVFLSVKESQAVDSAKILAEFVGQK